MRLYQYCSAKGAELALRGRRLKISRIHLLNDPFEFLGADLSDRDRRRALRATREQLGEHHGLLCLSDTWRNLSRFMSTWTKCLSQKERLSPLRPPVEIAAG